VAEEADARGREVLAQPGCVLLDHAAVGHVLLHVAHAAVDEHHPGLDLAVHRQLLEVGRGLRGDGAPRAPQRVGGVVGAAAEAQAPYRDQVVVAGDRQHAPLAHDGGALVGVGVVADDVAQAGEAFHAARLERGQRRVQRLAVAVDVA